MNHRSQHITSDMTSYCTAIDNQTH